MSVTIAKTRHRPASSGVRAVSRGGWCRRANPRGGRLGAGCRPTGVGRDCGAKDATHGPQRRRSRRGSDTDARGDLRPPARPPPRAGHGRAPRLGRSRAGLHLPGRPLHQLHHHGVAKGAVPVGTVRHRRPGAAVAAARPDHAAGAGRLLRDPHALPDVHLLGDEHHVPVAANQRADPAHLFAGHRLRPVPDGDPCKPTPDRRALPGLCPGHRDRLPAREPCRVEAAERCRTQGALQQGGVRERPEGSLLLQSRPAEVLRLGTFQRHLLLCAVQLHLAGGQHLALENAGYTWHSSASACSRCLGRPCC